MKYKLIGLVILILASINCYSQNERNPDNYYIFDKNQAIKEYAYYLTPLHIKYERFTPSMNEIQIAEKVIASYINSKSKSIDSLVSKRIVNPDDYFKQYIGYIDTLNNRLLYIKLTNNKWFEEGEGREDQKKSLILLIGSNPTFDRTIIIDLNKQSCNTFDILNPN